ncbi:MAG TPA: CRTAC1 family protein [Thermoanaerobaculia bacterium]|nr:CRTAC1 family protein [Thermoanaerobaculia bacterium]
MRKVLLVLVAAAAFLGGWWIYRNASIERLRAEYRPWMDRLARWRDGCEQIRRSLRSREPLPEDPPGVAALRAWAWDGLDRIAYVDYRVEKPVHETAAGRETTTGRVVFTVGGFGRGGVRVERAAGARVAEEKDASGSRVTAALETPLWNRTEASPRFHDATAEAGLGAPRHDPPLKLVNHLLSDLWPGSGVAVLDFDRDGFEDLFVADGVRSILYRNDGHGRFADVTERAGLARSATEGIAATGVAAADVDGDGYPDLFVTNAFGPARLFHNRGDGTFEETTAASGIAVPGNARSAAFADVDGDGDLDLFVAVTGDYYAKMPDPPFDANDGLENFLYLNDGHGHFTDATKAWGLSGMTRWTLSALFQDYDQDGRMDLMATNDFGLKNLYRNVDGRRFEDVAKKTGTLARAYGMSGAWADFDGDGRPDVYTTGTDTQWYFIHEYPSIPVGLAGRLFLPFAIRWCEEMASGNSLLLQKPDHTFENATARSGAQHAGWNWSAIAADLDDDGWPDVYATNGLWGDGRDRDVELEFWWQTLAYWDDYVAGTKTFDRKGAGVAGIERDRYFHNRGGAAAGAPLFEDRAFLDGLDLESNGRAAVAFDANGDGALDVYVRSVGAPEALFLGSRKPGEHYLRLRLSGTPGRDNRDGIGCEITAVLPGGRRLVTQNVNESGYLSTGSPIVHLGLGPATRLEGLTVLWPSGKKQDLGAVAAVDRTVVVDEERGVQVFEPGRR